MTSNSAVGAVAVQEVTFKVTFQKSFEKILKVIFIATFPEINRFPPDIDNAIPKE